MKPMIVVSACLAGMYCRYNGEVRTNSKVLDLLRQGLALPLCPEQLGGLPTPRNPLERVGQRVLDAEGRDYTGHFERGAEQCLRLARLVGAREAWLKSQSPTCGAGRIYDGTFSGRIVEGDGFFAQELRREGVEITSLDFDDQQDKK